MKKKLKNNKGFVILFAVTLSSIILAIALGITNVALKEVKFGTNARDTNDAFFAADTATEYAFFTDKYPNSSFVVVPGAKQTWNFVVSGLGGMGESCAKVSVEKDNTSVETTKTTIITKGYDTGDPITCDSSNPDRVEREIKTIY